MEDLSLEGFSEEQYAELKKVWQKYHDENNEWEKEANKGLAFRKFCKQNFQWIDAVIDANIKTCSALFEAGIKWQLKQDELKENLKAVEYKATEDMYKNKCIRLESKLASLENTLRRKGLYNAFREYFNR